MFKTFKLGISLLFAISVSQTAFATNQTCKLFNQDVRNNSKLLEERVEACEKIANAGNIDAQIEIIRIYLDNTLGWRDFTKAEKWARKVAESETARGYDLLGGLLALKPDMTKEEGKEAIQAYIKAYQMGVDNNLRLVELLERNNFILKTPEVLEWLKHKAESGDATFQNFLGEAYLKGLGVSQDTKEAISWYMRLLQQKKHYTTYAPYVLGSIYEKGKGGIAINKKKAIEFYKIAAERGDHNSKVKLSRLLNEDKPIPLLAIPPHDEQPPKWIAQLYSDGTMDIRAAYIDGKWQKVDINQWLTTHFTKDKLPVIPSSSATMLAIKKLNYQQKDIKSTPQYQWLPKNWYSLEDQRHYTVDRLAQLGSECDVWYSFVVQGKHPFDAILNNDEDEKPPIASGDIASWDIKSVPIQKIKLQILPEIKTLVLSDFNQKEATTFSNLKQRMKKYNPDFLQERKFISQHIWEETDRKKWRQIRSDEVRKIKILDGSFLYQILLSVSYKGSFSQAYYNAWLREDNGKFTLLDSHMTLADGDWKSISYESPTSSAWILDGKLYALGSYYAAGSTNLIYELSSSGAKPVFEVFDTRSCE